MDGVELIISGLVLLGIAAIATAVGKAMIDAGKKRLYEETYARLTA